MRIALGIEYDGFAFSGWQIQDGDRPTVQSKLETALSKVANETITKSQVTGRTDTGVHASEQIIHFDTSAERSVRSWVLGANRYLTDQTISVLWAHSVDNDFHARFSALLRMQEAAKYLVGEHDFNSYRTVKCQAKSSLKTVYFLNVSQRGEYFFIDIEANSFLHHMVRNIAGVLMSIGSGEADPEWALQVLDARDRTKAGKTAPSGGLYLTNVTYDKKFNLPQINSKTII